MNLPIVHPPKDFQTAYEGEIYSELVEKSWFLQ